MMRALTLSIFLATSLSAALAQGAEINWISVDELEAAQAREPRKVMIDVYTKWCGPCKRMMLYTFTNPDVISYINANYYAVKFDAEGPDPVEFKGQTFSHPTYVPNKPRQSSVHELSRAFQVRAYPTLVFLDEDLEMIAPITGGKGPQQLELYLRFFNEAWVRGPMAQKKWETFQESFTPTFQ